MFNIVTLKMLTDEKNFHLLSYELLSTFGIEKSLCFMQTILQDASVEDVGAVILDHAFNKLFPILRSNSWKLSHLGISRFALEVVRGKICFW